MAGAAAAAATGGTAGVSQATRSVHTGTRDARKATRLALVLYELHPLMESFLCTNFTTASRSSPGMVSSLLSPRRFLAGRSDLGLDELKGCCAERFGRGVLGFRQDGRLRRHDHPGVERGRPADDPQVFRVDGAKLDERSDLVLLARRPRDVRRDLPRERVLVTRGLERIRVLLVRRAHRRELVRVRSCTASN